MRSNRIVLSFLVLTLVLTTPWFGNNITKTYAKNELTAKFNEESFELLPLSIKEKLKVLTINEDGTLYQKGSVLGHSGEKTYVILSLGVRNTSGYAIQVKKVKTFGDQIIIWATELKPGDSMNSQVVTSPIKTISFMDKKNNFKCLTVIYN